MADDAERRDRDLERMQPGGALNPKLLVGIGVVAVIAAVVILIIVLSKT